MPEQVGALVAVNGGTFDDLPLEQVEPVEREIRQAMCRRLSEICLRIESGEKLSDEDRRAILGVAQETKQSHQRAPEAQS